MILTRRPLRTHGRALGRPVAEPVSGGGRSVLALLGRSRDRLPAWVTFVAIDLVRAKQVHRDDEALSYLRRLLAARPAAAGDALALSAVETGQPLLVEHVHEALRGPIAQEHGPYVERCGLRSVLIAPLRARGRVVGVLSLFRDGSSAAYTVDDQVFLEALAERAALAVDNARLYQEARDLERQRAEVLVAVAHDLKNLLSGIEGWAQLHERRAHRREDAPGEEGHAHLVQGLAAIKGAAAHALGMLEDLQHLARGCLGPS